MKVICPGNLRSTILPGKMEIYVNFIWLDDRKTSTYYSAEFKFSKEQCVKRSIGTLKV